MNKNNKNENRLLLVAKVWDSVSWLLATLQLKEVYSSFFDLTTQSWKSTWGYSTWFIIKRLRYNVKLWIVKNNLIPKM